MLFQKISSAFSLIGLCFIILPVTPKPHPSRNSSLVSGFRLKTTLASEKLLPSEFLLRKITNNRPFPSSLEPLFQNKSKCKAIQMKMFDFHENEPVGRTHFHINGFALRLVLTQRQKGIQKWPIQCDWLQEECSFMENMNTFECR